MIDPSDVIKFDRTDAELQEWFLFSAVVAGKTASIMARLLDRFLTSLPGSTPFEKVRWAIDNGVLEDKLREHRMGQYNKLTRCFAQVLDVDLRTCTVEDLEQITGIGPKTARMFIMHSRPNQRLAALDVHVLKHLNANGIKAPPSTPSSPKKYRELEEAFLQLADLSGKDPSAYDLEVWKLYSRSYVPRETGAA